MRWLRGLIGGVDSLDVAAVWPCSLAISVPLPPLQRRLHRGRREDEEDE